MGAGGALISGVNRLPPVGLMPFSVGDGGAALGGVVVVVVVVVVGVDGACSPPRPHAAVKAPIVSSAAAPTAAISRRDERSDFMKIKLV